MDIPGLVWKGDDRFISYEDIASYTAPMLWFSPDERLLYDDDGNKQLPNPFPFEVSNGPVVYYKFMHLYTLKSAEKPTAPSTSNLSAAIIDLESVKALELDFYYYFEEETGIGSHHHDIESITLKIKIIHQRECSETPFAIQVTQVTGRAHGVNWFNNVLDVDRQTFFPLSILIEEGKHASCTDKNADGQYTPNYDTSKRSNDAWGVRDIISSGNLVSGGYQAWMAKNRTPESILFPPLPKSSIYYEGLVKKFGNHMNGKAYELRPYPSYPRDDVDKDLNKLMKDKKPHKWPEIQATNSDGTVKRWTREGRAYRSLGLAYRWDDAQAVSFTFPLLIFKTVQAPMTGGYLFNKIHTGIGESELNTGGLVFEKLFGHQIVHTSSASKWIDTYVGLGYEIYDVDFDAEKVNYDVFFASEAGIKLRVNVTKTPFKFLSLLGTDFWGLRLGWKNVAFHPFISSGFVVEFGAGIF